MIEATPSGTMRSAACVAMSRNDGFDGVAVPWTEACAKDADSNTAAAIRAFFMRFPQVWLIGRTESDQCRQQALAQQPPDFGERCRASGLHLQAQPARAGGRSVRLFDHPAAGRLDRPRVHRVKAREH